MPHACFVSKPAMINLTAVFIQTGQLRKCGAQWLARWHPPQSAAPGRCVETSTEDDAQGTTAAACMYAQSRNVLAPTHRSVVPSSVPPQGNSEATHSVSYPPTCTPVTTLHSTRTPTIRCTLPPSHSSHTYLYTSTIPYAPLTSIPLSALSSPPLACINVPALAHLLHSHPDQPCTQYLLDGLTHGFPTGFHGQSRGRHACNLPSAAARPLVITQYILNECAAGHSLGPLLEPPFPAFVVNPLGAVPKKRAGT